jgi:cysteine-rich repeat protein
MTGLRLCGWTLAVVAGTSACSDGGDSGDEDGTSDGGSTAPDDSAGPTTLDSASSTAPDPDGTDVDGTDATTEPVPECGNGVREDPEQCDDGNLDPGDGCDVDCTEVVDTRLWEDVVGGAASVQESGQGIVCDSANNVIAVGYLVDAVGNPNVWVKKYDPEGNELWTQVLDPSTGFDDRGHGVDVDAQDNIYVSGDIGVSESASDVWLAKLDPGGQMQWQYTFDGPEGTNDIGEDVAIDTGGNAYVVGSVRVAANDADIFVAKVDPAGVEVWTDIVAGPNVLEDRAMGVDVDADGNAIVTGFVSDDGFKRDVWLRKYDPAGGEVWTTIWDSTLGGVDAGYDVAVAPDGSIGVAGSTPVIATNEEVWLGRFDADGALVWQKDFGGPMILNDHGLGIATDSESSFVVVGFKGVGDTDSDIWLRKWDVGGNVVWTQSFRGDGLDRDQALAVAVDGNDDIAATGEIRPEANNNGEIWVAKLGGTVE